MDPVTRAGGLRAIRATGKHFRSGPGNVSPSRPTRNVAPSAHSLDGETFLKMFPRHEDAQGPFLENVAPLAFAATGKHFVFAAPTGPTGKHPRPRHGQADGATFCLLSDIGKP